MDKPTKVVKEEPRKSLFVLLASGVFFLLIGAVVLFFGSPEREPMIRQAGLVALVIGGLAVLFYLIARRQKVKRR